MTNTPQHAPQQPSQQQGALVVETTITFTLEELGRASRSSTDWLQALVDEGVLAPRRGAREAPSQWQFSDDALRRARTAARLARDFELNVAALALVLDLLDRIDAMDARRR